MTSYFVLQFTQPLCVAEAAVLCLVYCDLTIQCCTEKRVCRKSNTATYFVRTRVAGERLKVVGAEERASKNSKAASISAL